MESANSKRCSFSFLAGFNQNTLFVYLWEETVLLHKEVTCLIPPLSVISYLYLPLRNSLSNSYPVSFPSLIIVQLFVISLSLHLYVISHLYLHHCNSIPSSFPFILPLFFFVYFPFPSLPRSNTFIHPTLPEEFAVRQELRIFITLDKYLDPCKINTRGHAVKWHPKWSILNSGTCHNPLTCTMLERHLVFLRIRFFASDMRLLSGPFCGYYCLRGLQYQTSENSKTALPVLPICWLFLCVAENYRAYLTVCTSVRLTFPFSSFSRESAIVSSIVIQIVGAPTHILLLFMVWSIVMLPFPLIL